MVVAVVAADTGAGLAVDVIFGITTQGRGVADAVAGLVVSDVSGCTAQICGAGAGAGRVVKTGKSRTCVMSGAGPVAGGQIADHALLAGFSWACIADVAAKARARGIAIADKASAGRQPAAVCGALTGADAVVAVAHRGASASAATVSATDSGAGAGVAGLFGRHVG